MSMPMPTRGNARAVLCLLGVLLVALLGLLGPAVPAEAATQPLRTGVSYVYEDDVAAFEHVKQAGAQLALTPLAWGRIVPKQQPTNWQPEDPADPNYNWSHYDLWVRHAVEAGLTPILQVRGAPPWAQRCAFTSVDSPCDPDPAALAAFTKAAVRRYSGTFAGLPRVRYWQGLNEPNLSIFFNPQYDGDKAVSPRLYRTLINTFYTAVKSVDPSNIVIAAGLGPIAVPKYTIGPMRFTRELLCMRGRDRFRPTQGNCHGGVYFDIFDVHPYTTGGPTHEGGVNDVQLGDLRKLKALLQAADEAGRIKGRFRHTPLWVTEFSWDSNPPDPGGLPMKIATRWTAEALHQAWRAGISEFFWFSLRDFAPEPQLPFSETLQSGLYFRGPTVAADQPKELLYAFRFPFVSFATPEGLTFWGRTPTSRPGNVAIQIWKGGQWRNVAATRADQAGIFRGLVQRRYGRNRRGLVRAVSRGEKSIPFSMQPVPDFPHPPFG
jgi:hypothetical protein